ncbi:MAG: cation-transporting P-type ATPase [Anaerolineae bacterium]
MIQPQDRLRDGSAARTAPGTDPHPPSALAGQPVWHTMDTMLAAAQLDADTVNGLTEKQARDRLAQVGPNELVEKPLTSPLAILWEQITNPLVLLLIGAAVVSALLGKVDSVIAISAIVVLNAILGVVQEYRAEQAMAALKKMLVKSSILPREAVRRPSCCWKRAASSADSTA